MFITVAKNKAYLGCETKSTTLYQEADCFCCNPWYVTIFCVVLKEFSSRTTCLLLGVELQHKLSKQSGNINTFFPPY